MIGGGPVGLIVALELARRGRRVLVLESGGRGPRAAAQALSAGGEPAARRHLAPEITVARRLGGTSNLWGGRCLPFDPIDFAARPWLGAAGLADRAGGPRALAGAGLRRARRRRAGVLRGAARGGGGRRLSASRAWSAGATCRGSQVLHRRGAAAAGNPGGARGHGARLRLRGRADRRGSRRTSRGRGRGRIAAAQVVLAAGGNESTRLLLAEQRARPELFGGARGPLGRFYMGHVIGRIAEIAFENRALHDGLDFHVARGSYVRRGWCRRRRPRRRQRLTNVAFWPVVPRARRSRAPLGAAVGGVLVLSVGPLGRRLVAEAIRERPVGDAAVPARRRTR